MYQASELLEQNARHDPTVTGTPPTFTAVDTRHEEDNLSEGEYAGIVIGVLVAFIVLGAIVFFLFKRRDEESAQHSAVPTSQV
jgi:heme/copper-type cytochrome/quinol oxidase subunit 2